MEPAVRKCIERAIDATINTGCTNRDEALLAVIEALLRDALGQNHGVWRWRVPDEYKRARVDMKGRKNGTRG